MEWGKQMEINQKNMIHSTYHNSRYTNERNRKKTLILDVDDSNPGDNSLGSGTEFSIDLYEPLNIDKHSEIYLDNFTTFNSNVVNNTDNLAFCLKINEFNMNSNVASSNNNPSIFNSLIIPNEHTSPFFFHNLVVHKSKKFNYICDINPGTIGRLSGKITNLGGNPIFHGLGSSGRFTYSLTGISESIVAGTITSPLQPGDVITNITNGSGSVTNAPGQGSRENGIILVSSPTDSSTIHFSTDHELTTTEFENGSGQIQFSITENANRGGATGTITISNASATANPDIQLIRSNARFIAEFSIISRE